MATRKPKTDPALQPGESLVKYHLNHTFSPAKKNHKNIKVLTSF